MFAIIVIQSVASEPLLNCIDFWLDIVQKETPILKPALNNGKAADGISLKKATYKLNKCCSILCASCVKYLFTGILVFVIRKWYRLVKIWDFPRWESLGINSRWPIGSWGSCYYTALVLWNLFINLCFKYMWHSDIYFRKADQSQGSCTIMNPKQN